MRESNFAVSTPLILSSLLSFILNPKSCPKSSPRGSQIQSKTSFETSCQYGCDSEANLAPTWTQLGSMLASKIDQKSILEARAPPKAPVRPLKGRFCCQLGPNLAPTWAQLGPMLAPCWPPKSFKNRSWTSPPLLYPLPHSLFPFYSMPGGRRQGAQPLDPPHLLLRR